MKADDTAEKREHGEEPDASDETALDVEMALLALAATNDVGGPMGEFDLSTLSVAEKRALLSYMRRRFNLAPDTCDPLADENCEQEPDAVLPKSKPE